MVVHEGLKHIDLPLHGRSMILVNLSRWRKEEEKEVDVTQNSELSSFLEQAISSFIESRLPLSWILYPLYLGFASPHNFFHYFHYKMSGKLHAFGSKPPKLANGWFMRIWLEYSKWKGYSHVGFCEMMMRCFVSHFKKYIAINKYILSSRC